MAAFDTTRPTFNAPAAHGFLGHFADLLGRVAEWNDARVTRNALNKLSDRELEDIGLVRGDIESVCKA
jgi:uncharacterized protein YjiS (DUF1127 family)